MEKETIFGKGLLKSISDKIKINDSDKKARYKTCIIISASGKPAFGIIYETIWDQVAVGDQVSFALSLLDDNKTLIPSVAGLVIESLSYEDFGVAAPAPVVEDDMEDNPFA
jgi:hypothetical protein